MGVQRFMKIWIIICVLSILLCFGVTACRKAGEDRRPNEPIVTNRTLYIVGQDTANGVVCYAIEGLQGISCVKVRTL